MATSNTNSFEDPEHLRFDTLFSNGPHEFVALPSRNLLLFDSLIFIYYLLKLLSTRLAFRQTLFLTVL